MLISTLCLALRSCGKEAGGRILWTRITGLLSAIVGRALRVSGLELSTRGEDILCWEVVTCCYCHNLHAIHTMTFT